MNLLARFSLVRLLLAGGAVIFLYIRPLGVSFLSNGQPVLVLAACTDS